MKKSKIFKLGVLLLIFFTTAIIATSYGKKGNRGKGATATAQHQKMVHNTGSNLEKDESTKKPADSSEIKKYEETDSVPENTSDELPKPGVPKDSSKAPESSPGIALEASIDGERAEGPEMYGPLSLQQAYDTLRAINEYIDYFQKDMTFTVDRKVRTIKFKFAFITPEDEAKWEARSFLDHDWLENLPKLAELVKQAGPDVFKYDIADKNFQESFVAVSMGTTATHGFYRDKGQIRTFNYAFGTDSDPNVAPLREMVGDLVSIGRPMIFFNALSYARLAGMVSNEAHFINLNCQVKFNPTQRTSRFTGAMANRLVAELIGINRHAFLLNTPKTDQKFTYRWTSHLINSLPEFSFPGVHFAGDISNKSCSERAVKDQKFIDGKNLVLSDTVKDQDKINNIDNIIKFYKRPPKNGVHPDLIKIKDLFKDSAKNYIKTKAKDNPEDIYVVVGQTGKFAELYFDCLKLVNQSPKTSFAVANSENQLEIKNLKAVRDALEQYLAYFNQSRTFNINGKKITLNINLNFLSLDQEVEYEAEDFFNYNWNNNKNKLELLATSLDDDFYDGISKINGDSFRNREGFVVVSIGSFFSYGYYVENKNIKTFQYNFGTDSQPQVRDTLLAQMTDELKHIKAMDKDHTRPIVFTNAIAYAGLVGIMDSNQYFIRITPDASFSEIDLEKDKKIISSKNSGIFANVLKKALARDGLETAYIYKARDKAGKLHHKWTNYLVKEFDEFKGQQKDIIGDISGKTFSGKSVEQKEFDDTKNLIEALGKNMDKYDNQQEIYTYFENIFQNKDPYTPTHPTLVLIKDKFMSAIDTFLTIEAGEKNSKIGNQTSCNLVVRHTGKLSELYYNTIKRLRDLQSGSYGPQEEKKEKPPQDPVVTIKTKEVTTKTPAAAQAKKPGKQPGARNKGSRSYSSSDSEDGEKVTPQTSQPKPSNNYGRDLLNSLLGD